MSLLMDALRKAEEAKKLAAKQAKGVQENSTSAETPAASVIEEPLAIDLSNESGGDDFSTRLSSSPSIADLEEAFEFEIDESFGLDTAKSESHDAADENNAHLVDFDSSGLSPIAPTLSDEESQDDIANTPESLVEFSPSLSLENREETAKSGIAEKTQAEEIDSGLAANERSESTAEGNLDSTLESYLQKDTVVEPAFIAASESPLRALREDADVALQDKRSSDSLARKAGAAIENRKRESARAVFNAKSANINSARRVKVLALVLACVVIPLGGLGFWLIDPLGLFSSPSQYNVPIASYDPNRSLSDVLEPGLTGTEDQALPDVSETTLNTTLEEMPVAEDGVTTAAVDSELPVQDAVIDPSQDITAEAEAASQELPGEQVVQQEMPPRTDIETIALEEQAFIAPIAATESDAGVELDSTSPEEFAVQEPATQSSAINIIRSESPQIDPQLSLAFNAYRDNDFVTARAHYQQALRNLPNNRDALLGLAAVALKIGDANAARGHYTKLLELDPRDPLARVGLLETVPASDSTEREGELRALFSEHPNIPQLAFALGNLQASQGRWNDAQQSYYDALLAAKSGVNGPITPDYAFNLAVSLERLNQLRPAYEFYREALAQSQTVSPTFDVRILRERLDALERVLP